MDQGLVAVLELTTQVIYHLDQPTSLGLYVRVKNYVAWIKKHVDSGECTKKKKKKKKKTKKKQKAKNKKKKKRRKKKKRKKKKQKKKSRTRRRRLNKSLFALPWTGGSKNISTSPLLDASREDSCLNTDEDVGEVEVGEVLPTPRQPPSPQPPPSTPPPLKPSPPPPVILKKPVKMQNSDPVL